MSQILAQIPLPANFRFYKIDGMQMPSVTSILKFYGEESESLKQWRARTKDWEAVMQFRANVGTLVHNKIGQYFMDKFGLKETTPQKINFESTDKMEVEAEAAMSYFMDFIKEFQVEPIGIEVKSWHRKMKYAGTIDFIGVLNGIETLIDWKTSYAIYEHYLSQVISYKKAFMSDPENKFDIKRCVVVLVNPRNGLKVGQLEHENIAWDKFWECFDKFQKQFREPHEILEKVS